MIISIIKKCYWEVFRGSFIIDGKRHIKNYIVFEQKRGYLFSKSPVILGVLYKHDGVTREQQINKYTHKHNKKVDGRKFRKQIEDLKESVHLNRMAKTNFSITSNKRKQGLRI